MAAGGDKGISFFKFQADNKRREQAIIISKQTPKLLKSPGLNNLEKPAHRSKLISDALSAISFLF